MALLFASKALFPAKAEAFCHSKSCNFLKLSSIFRRKPFIAAISETDAFPFKGSYSAANFAMIAMAIVGFVILYLSIKKKGDDAFIPRKVLKDRNALVFYVSDHGEPLGENGIRTRGDEKVFEARSIPFIVWMSDSFRAANPHVYETIQANLNVPVSHNNLIYSILDCAGIQSDFITDGFSICSPNLLPHIDTFLPSGRGTASPPANDPLP